jgi:peptide/nickel transport system ATP-binding protein
MTAAAEAPNLLEVRGLNVRFVGDEGIVTAVDDVSFTLSLGQTLCLLGESGCGKTVTMRSLMRLLPATARLSGSVRLDGLEVTTLHERELLAIRGSKVAMVFQDPMSALDPVFTIGQQIMEVVVAHEGVSRTKARARALALLELVQIPSAKSRLDAFPHELSGGLRQRAMIALALSCRPKLLLADEPTTALDATVQIQILILLRELQRELGMAIMLVTHDLGVASEIADRVAVMYAGRLVETADIGDLIRAPVHPYTAGLLASTVNEQTQDGVLTPIPGAPPNLSNLPKGCAFAPRCTRTVDRCTAEAPQLVGIGPGRAVRCHLAVPIAAELGVGQARGIHR